MNLSGIYPLFTSQQTTLLSVVGLVNLLQAYYITDIHIHNDIIPRYQRYKLGREDQGTMGKKNNLHTSMLGVSRNYPVLCQ